MLARKVIRYIISRFCHHRIKPLRDTEIRCIRTHLPEVGRAVENHSVAAEPRSGGRYSTGRLDAALSVIARFFPPWIRGGESKHRDRRMD